MKRIFHFLLCLTLVFSLITPINAYAEATWPDYVPIQAEGGIVMDADTGTVLYGKNIHTAYYPASITKIMTALVVIENCSLDEMVTFSHNAVYNVEAGSSSAGLDEGDVLSVRDCLYALLLKSANESANALAEHVAGSTEAFAEMMNAKAASLGCQDSHFANPSGLNNPDHYVSAYDMALIGRAALNNPTFLEIDSTLYYDLPVTKRNPEGGRIYPGHKMLKKNMPEYYEGCIGGKTGTFGIPEMGTNFVRQMLLDAQPKNFSELIQISGLSHGTDVWTGNADELIRSGTCTIAEVIGCRDSIMLYLLRKGLEPKMSFDIMEAVRKGKVAKGGFKPGWEEAMREHDVPDWYIESCRKIKYMFPKAHAVAYLMAAIRLMWFKVYHPAIFYAVYFTVRGADIDYEAAVGGVRVAKQHLRDNEKIPKDERTAKDDDALVSLQLENEMLQRGCEFLPIELGRSYASKYVVEDGKVRLPFTAIRGLGDAAAAALEQATMHGQEYISVEELQQASGVAQSVFDKLRAVGALGNLPETSQVDLFSMI